MLLFSVHFCLLLLWSCIRSIAHILQLLMNIMVVTDTDDVTNEADDSDTDYMVEKDDYVDTSQLKSPVQRSELM